MNRMQLTAFNLGSSGLNRAVGQIGSNRYQTLGRVQAEREGFSGVLERSCNRETAVKVSTPERIRDNGGLRSTENKTPEAPVETRTNSGAEDKSNADPAKLEGKKMQDQSVKDRSVPDQPMQVQSDHDESREDQDATQKDLISQLSEILSILGLNFPVTANADADSTMGGSAADGNGQTGQLQAGNLLNSAQRIPGQTELSQLLNQLINVLDKQGSLSNGLSELKTLAESGLSQNNDVPVTEFLGKLLETAKQALLSGTQSEAGNVTSATAALKSAPEVEVSSLYGTAAKTAELVTSDPSEAAKVTAEDPTVMVKSPDSVDSGNTKNFSQDHQDNGKEPKDPTDMVPGMKPLKHQVDNSNVTLNVGQHDPGDKFQIQQGVQVSQVPGSTLKTEVAAMPRMTQLIFDQIAQKARIVVAPGTTEMQIQLKPDFLGKLNLNISSDNGLVTAKFIAESHAVKGIIEANLNTLKDALAQQGVKVDQLVVDVGSNNHQSGFENRGGSYGNGQARRNTVSVNNQEIENLFPDELQARSVRDYYGSTVEYRA